MLNGKLSEVTMTKENTDIEKLSLNSLSITKEKQKELLRIFPEILTEGGKIDFDKLKLALGEMVDVGKERYGMIWPGKGECFKTIQTPSYGTLLPMRDQSIKFENAENLFIEGDNLEVLKLLQKPYLGQVKCIYIDPPYNTGKEFIYPDNYNESLQTYLEYTGQIDSQGKKYGTNSDTDGRFHSKWLNMMFTRLYLARNLLSDDGVIFISIDDNEAMNLKKICDEIFGEDCFVADLTVVNNLKGRNDKKYIATANERVFMYVKSEEFNEYGLELSADILNEYKEEDVQGKYRLIELRKRGGPDTRAERPRMFYSFFVNPANGSVKLEKDNDHIIEALPVKSDGVDGRWRWGKDTALANIHFLIGKPVQGTSRYNIYEKDYLEQEGDVRRIKPKSVMSGAAYSTDGATKAYRALMGGISFDNPKPVPFLQDLIGYSAAPNSNAIILDFFAGSGTTAQAVIELNAKDSGNRKFICIQLPEECEPESSLYKLGYKTIADICKERIRRVIKASNLDVGVKVFKLTDSNFKTWNQDISNDNLEKQLELHVDHVKHDRTADDILFEILLKSGFPLTTRFEIKKFGGKTIYSIAGGMLLVCLEDNLTLELIKFIAEQKPERIVCLDHGFANNDQLKANAVQIFKTKGITSFRTV